MGSYGIDKIFYRGRIYTGDKKCPWVEALAVSEGKIKALGSTQEIQKLASGNTHQVDLGDRFMMPGISDGHIHLGLGGKLIAFELSLDPTDSLDTVLKKVEDWATNLDEGEWVVGGTVGSTELDKAFYDVTILARLDAASQGHPVLLRDDTMHNRWVNTAAMKIMGIDDKTPDPEGGRYVKDKEGRLTGVFAELASTVVEEHHEKSIADPEKYQLEAVRAAIKLLNSHGITSLQESASMKKMFRALSQLENEGELTSWVVTSTPSRTFIEPGETGKGLYDYAANYRTKHVFPDFVKFVLDGVPMTRTSAMLAPYICHHHGEDPDFCGVAFWELKDLVLELQRITERGLGAKLHATGDAAVRLALDAIQKIREEGNHDAKYHIAHTEFISPSDMARFAGLNVVADASPHIWYPGVLQAGNATQIPAKIVNSSWPNKTLLESGAIVAAGSDWPCSLPDPSPWIGLESIVTRKNPLNPTAETLNFPEALSLEQAIYSFTAGPAQAMGLGKVTGTLEEGMSADFIVLNHNLFEIPLDQIHSTKVESTWFEGREVFKRE